MTENIEKSIQYLRAEFAQSEYYAQRNAELQYRVAHSFRVANIGREIARREGFDEEGLVIACLLHDVSYADGITDEKAWREHGRASAKKIRPFLSQLDLSPRQVDEICLAVAVHAEDPDNLRVPVSAFMRSVSDADNIDRYDAYRLLDSMHSAAWITQPPAAQLQFIEKELQSVLPEKDRQLSTITATEMWKDKIQFRVSALLRLKRQLLSGLKLSD